MMDNPFYAAAALIIPLVIAIVFHEVAHGWVAGLLGDPTAREMKRLSLNPIRHVDPIGTVVLPGMLMLAHLPAFGWAKPVPVNKWRLRNPRLGMMAVAAAGPATNFLLAFLASVALGLLARNYAGLQAPTGVVKFVQDNLVLFISINIFLALFNLIPIPPFDGSHILEGMLPSKLAMAYEKLRPFGFPILFLLLIVLPWLLPEIRVLDWVIGPPFEWAAGIFNAVAKSVALL